jgi:hypothetical protein
MTPAELRLTCIELFGKRGWQIGLARFLKQPDGSHVNVRTVRRWDKGEYEVPFWVVALLQTERERKAAMSCSRPLNRGFAALLKPASRRIRSPAGPTPSAWHRSRRPPAR